jgi:ATP-dependent Lon protease
MRKRAFLAGFSVYVAATTAQFIPPAQAALIAVARQQQAPPEPPLYTQEQNTPSTTRKIKIWTNDDLIATRTPADIYIFEKEARAAANEVAAFKTVTSCFAFNQPEGTIEETQKAIQDTLQSVRDSEDAVAQARNALADAPETLKARNQMELDRRTTELENSREQLRVLQEHLQQLGRLPAVDNSAAPTKSPSN